MSKFGGGITPYVEGQPPRKYSTTAADEAVNDYEARSRNATSRYEAVTRQ